MFLFISSQFIISISTSFAASSKNSISQASEEEDDDDEDEDDEDDEEISDDEEEAEDDDDDDEDWDDEEEDDDELTEYEEYDEDEPTGIKKSVTGKPGEWGQASKNWDNIKKHLIEINKKLPVAKYTLLDKNGGNGGNGGNGYGTKLNTSLPSKTYVNRAPDGSMLTFTSHFYGGQIIATHIVHFYPNYNYSSTGNVLINVPVKTPGNCITKTFKYNGYSTTEYYYFNNKIKVVLKFTPMGNGQSDVRYNMYVLDTNL